MKLFNKLIAVCLFCFLTTIVVAQGPTCQTATPMCNDITPYPINYTGTGLGGGPQAPAGNNYSCLSTTGNPTFFTITITQSGSINFNLQNTNVVDVDFILWGPFNNLIQAYAACGSLGTGGVNGGVVDCSYDPQAFESVNISNATTGQVYIMMVTNYENTATNVFSTPNTGTGALGCPCELDVNYTLPPLANNLGTLTAVNNDSAEFKVCPGDTLYFNVGVSADNIADSLSLFNTITTIGSAFNTNQYAIFGPFYPNAPLRDTMDFIVRINPGSATGIYNFNLGVLNTGTSSCFDAYPITVVVPGIPPLPQGDTICSGETYQLSAGSFPPTASGTNSYLWTQIAGPAAVISNNSIANPTVTPPIIPSGDSMSFQLQYGYGGCVFRDTIKIYGYDIDINMTAAPNPVCAGQPVNLTAVLSDTVGKVVTTTCAPNYTFALIPFAPVAAGGTTVTLGDDAISTARPIGFPFTFYCNSYTQFYISSNGYITFSAGAPAGTVNQVIPNAAAPNNLIALNWTDLDPSGGGTIRYQTLGVAPNRRLVVTYTSVPTFSTSNWFASDFVTVQAILYEGTNIIEQHITYAADDFDPFLGALAPITIGIENATGTVASSPGVNGTSGVYNNQAVRYTPNITTTTTISPITYNWTPSSTLNNSTIYNPIGTPASPTTYHVTIQNGACVFTDSIQVNITGSLPAPTVLCGVSTYTTIPFSWTALALPGGGFYQYSINGGATWVNAGTSLSAVLTGLAPGTTVTILVRGNDGLGTVCSPGAQGTITCSTLPCMLTNTPVVTDNVCFGDSTGAIDNTPLNGSPTYVYTWSNGRTTQDQTGLLAGVYNLTITDAVGCSVTNSITVTQPAKGLGLTMAGVNPLCNGGTGCASVDVAFGTGNYTYNWTTIGISTDSVCGLLAGTYIVTVTDDVGGGKTCYAYDSITLTQPTAVTATISSSTNVSCNGGTNGSATVTSSGGTGGHTFVWTNGQTTATSTGLGAGTHCVTVSDANGCTATACVTITQPSAVTATISSSTNVSCNGGANGSATVTGSGGTGGYTYIWTNGVTTASNTGLVANTYCVTVSDANSCTTSTCVTITEPTTVTATISSSSSVTCNSGTDGSATAAGSGGTGVYTYVWTNGQTTATSTGLGAGTHCVTISDANNCTATACVTITEPTAVTASIASSTSVTCNSACDGSVTAIGSGGVGGYTYLWSNSVTTDSNTGLCANTYTVTVNDGNGCMSTANVTISEPTAVTASLASSTSVTCNGVCDGDASVSASGGVGGYTYLWSNGVTTASNTGLCAGNYDVTVTDGNGCTATTSVSINEPSPVSASIPSFTIATCNLNNGSATAAGAGGDGNYTYLWTNSSTDITATGLAAGTHDVTITDGNGCTATASVNITQPGAVVVAIDSVYEVSCTGASDGAIFVTGSGGTTPYTYLWSTTSTDEDINGLPAGTYTVTITDANSCTNVISTTLLDPTVVSITIDNTTPADCNGAASGTATISSIGGTGTHTYLWSTGATTATATGLAANMTHMVTVTDANGCVMTQNITVSEPSALSVVVTSFDDPSCNLSLDGAVYITVSGGTTGYSYLWSSGSVTTQDLTGIASGTYTVTVTDANGCTTTTSQSISAPNAVEVFTSYTDVSCSGGSNGTATAVGSSGVPGPSGYSFIWSNNLTTATITGLTAGSYSVTITDQNMCTDTASVIITAPPFLVVTTTQTPISCIATSSGTITANAAGGTSPYTTYAWSGAASGQTTMTAIGLVAGSYTVTVTDANLCTATATTTITPVTPLDSATVPLITVVGALNCDLTPIGELTITPTSGTGYTYLWSNNGTDATATGLASGTYTVTITNSTGCTFEQTGTVTAPIVPNVNPFIGNAGVTSVTVGVDESVVIDGGNDQSGQGVTYVWTSSSSSVIIGNNTSHTTTAISSEAGVYTLTITATAGPCTDTGSVMLTVEEAFVGIPDAFAPDNDNNKNNLFRPVTLKAEQIEIFRVFNRWGQLVYEGSNLEGDGWDGKYMGVAQPADVYLYLLQYKLTSNSETITTRGEVTLLR